MQGAKSIIRVSSEKLLGGGGLQEEGIGRSKNLKASSLKVPMVVATERKAFQRYLVVQDARKILDRTFSVHEEGLKDARGRKEEVQVDARFRSRSGGKCQWGWRSAESGP